MDNNINQQMSEDKGYQTLGKKVFWLFFLQISPIAFILFLVAIIIFILSFQTFLTDTAFGNLQSYILEASFFTFIISLITATICTIFSWLTYKNFVFCMAEDSFKIKKGIFNKTENAIPYRQIQNVDIERDLLFQMLGLSRLILLTAGHEDETIKGSDEAEGVIPAIDKKIAEWLQTELLKRSDIQKTVAVDNNQPAK